MQAVNDEFSDKEYDEYDEYDEYNQKHYVYYVCINSL